MSIPISAKFVGKSKTIFYENKRKNEVLFHTQSLILHTEFN